MLNRRSPRKVSWYRCPVQSTQNATWELDEPCGVWEAAVQAVSAEDSPARSESEFQFRLTRHFQNRVSTRCPLDFWLDTKMITHDTGAEDPFVLCSTSATNSSGEAVADIF